MSDKHESFHYTYSSKQQEEIKQIRENISPTKKIKWIS